VRHVYICGAILIENGDEVVPFLLLPPQVVTKSGLHCQ
jgi:hypothetical protein